MEHIPFEYGGLHFIPEQRFEPQGQYHRRIPLSRMGQEAEANLFPGEFSYSHTDCPALRVAEATAKGYADILPGECVDLTMPSSKTRRGRAMREKANCLTTSCQYYQYCKNQKPCYNFP